MKFYLINYITVSYTHLDVYKRQLYRFALEPIAEITADTNTFGFRQNRSARDAIVKTVEILSKCPEYEWVMKADIKSCFDRCV